MADIRSEAFSRKEARIQENEGFAIIWREAQRVDGERRPTAPACREATYGLAEIIFCPHN
jgi:hypothetical protein